MFGRNIVLRGTVIVRRRHTSALTQQIVASEGNRIELPDGSVLENSACDAKAQALIFHRVHCNRAGRSDGAGFSPATSRSSCAGCMALGGH